MKKILFISKQPLGMNLDYFIFLKKIVSQKKYTATFLAPYSKESLKIEGLNYIPIKSIKNKYFAQLFITIQALKLIYRSKYDFIFIEYFIFTFFLPLFTFFKKKINLDVRTGSVSSKGNKIKNIILKFNTFFFKKITIIDKDLAKMLNLKNTHYLPLGGYKFNINSKKEHSDCINLLYIGTLTNRQTIDTVKAVIKLINEGYNLKYNIIGEGDDYSAIEAIIDENKMKTKIELHGYQHIITLKNIFQLTDIGISYVPLKAYFQNQPPTKTYDYLVNGIPVIATSTNKNKEIINNNNGILVSDNTESFKLGLKKMLKNLNDYKFKEIQKNNKKYSWDTIGKRILDII